MREDVKKARPDGGASGQAAGSNERAAQQSHIEDSTQTEQKSTIYDILPVGADHAVSRRELSALTGLPDRQLRRKIAEERRSGLLILSSSESNGGYYRPADASELRRYVRSMQSRRRAILAAIESAQKAIYEEEQENG